MKQVFWWVMGLTFATSGCAVGMTPSASAPVAVSAHHDEALLIVEFEAFLAARSESVSAAWKSAYQALSRIWNVQGLRTMGQTSRTQELESLDMYLTGRASATKRALLNFMQAPLRWVDEEHVVKLYKIALDQRGGFVGRLLELVAVWEESGPWGEENCLLTMLTDLAKTAEKWRASEMDEDEDDEEGDE